MICAEPTGREIGRSDLQLDVKRNWFLERSELSRFAMTSWIRFSNRHDNRHCEPTGRANARPMTGSARTIHKSAKQVRVDCFVAIAPRNDLDTVLRSRGAISPEFCFVVPPSESEGAGNAGRPTRPQPRMQNKKHTS
jgi:hypothetical protein